MNFHQLLEKMMSDGASDMIQLDNVSYSYEKLMVNYSL